MGKRISQRREKQLERAMWARRLAAAIAVTGCAAMLPSLFSGMQNRAAVAAPKEPLLLRELRESIERMDRALLPAQRKAAAARIARRQSEFEPLLLTLLAQPQNALFAGAASISAELALDGALEILLESLPQTKERARVAALLAIDALDPLADAEVEDLLLDIDNRIVLAGLQIASRREPLPESLVAPILSTLRLDDRELRAHALACLPQELSDQHVDTVLGLVDEFPEDSGFAALLLRIEPSERGTDRLLAYLEAADAETIVRLSPVLERYGTAPAIRTGLWSIALGTDEVERRASALYCLELAGVHDGIPSLTTDWPPRLQYQLARLQLSGGDAAGLDTLLDLAFVDAVDDPELEEAVGLARLLLGRLSHLPPHATEDELRAWRKGLTSTSFGPLPPPSR